MSSTGTAQSSSPPTKASLLKWWKIFSSRPTQPTPRSTATASASSPAAQAGKIRAPPYRPPGRGLSRHESADGKVFGVHLEQSLKYASVAISAVGPDGSAYVYGYVPIVVAKCGMMLKETATATEGIFRVSGSNKRINQLQQEFDQPPRYGKDLDWAGYSQHDAASVLRRYLNSMPDPVIPQDLYHLFTSVLQQDLPQAQLIASYKHLITLLPPSSRYLLLYLLDFLSVFARLSHQNLMTASNLAVVFQPGLVSSRREGDTADLLGFPGVTAAGERGKGEHGRGKEVLEFLIEQQEEFMVGLQPPGPNELPHDLQGRGAVAVRAGERAAAAAAASSSSPAKRDQSIPSPSFSGGESGAKGLERKGSEKNAERRRARTAAKNDEGNTASRERKDGVKRSRTLPGRKSDVTPGSVEDPSKAKAEPERLRKKRDAHS